MKNFRVKKKFKYSLNIHSTPIHFSHCWVFPQVINRRLAVWALIRQQVETDHGNNNFDNDDSDEQQSNVNVLWPKIIID